MWGFPATIIALGFTSLFTDIGSEMIFPVLPLFLRDQLHAGTTFIGIVEGVADSVSSLLKLISGYFSDRWSQRKPLVVFGYGLASVVRPLIALATAPWQVLAIRLSDRVGKGVRTSPRDALIADVAFPGQVGRAFGFHRAMDHAGAMFGPLITTVLLALGFQLRTIFGLTLIPGATCLAILIRLKEPSQVKTAAVKIDTTSVSHATAPLPQSLQFYLGILFLFSLGNSSDAFLLLRARDVGIATTLIPALWAALHVVKLISSYWGGVLSDRVPRIYLIIGGWLIFAGTYWGLALAQQSWHVWLWFLMYGLYYGFTEPTEKALVKDLAPATARGKAYGYYNFIVGISALPASLLTGWLWRSLGPIWALGLGASMAGLASIFLLSWQVWFHNSQRSKSAI